MTERVNHVAGQGWEVFDVAFTNLSGYLVCYRRLVPRGTPRHTYAFDLVTPRNAEARANEASQSGWKIYKVVSCTPRLHCLCYRRAPPGRDAYSFETSPGAQLAERANAAAQRGWELLDVGFGDVSGYLLCYRRLPRDAPRPTYRFMTPRGRDVEAEANAAGQQGWELFRMVACLQDRYGLCFRRTPASRHAYSFERAGGKNLESLADRAVAQGLQVYRVVASPAGDVDYSDVGDILPSGVPYMLCVTRRSLTSKP